MDSYWLKKDAARFYSGVLRAWKGFRRRVLGEKSFLYALLEHTREARYLSTQIRRIARQATSAEGERDRFKLAADCLALKSIYEEGRAIRAEAKYPQALDRISQLEQQVASLEAEIAQKKVQSWRALRNEMRFVTDFLYNMETVFAVVDSNGIVHSSPQASRLLGVSLKRGDLKKYGLDFNLVHQKLQIPDEQGIERSYAAEIGPLGYGGLSVVFMTPPSLRQHISYFATGASSLIKHAFRGLRKEYTSDSLGEPA